MIRRFATRDELYGDAAAIVAAQLESPPPAAAGLMLTGGTTPVPLYERLSDAGVSMSPQSHIVLSDERYVPAGDAAHNFSQMSMLLMALNARPDHVHAPDTTLSLEACAAAFDAELAALRAETGLGLAILGLGADGHLASLFTDANVRAGEGRNAIAVTRPEPPDRISVTAGLLQSVRRVIFITLGASKAAIVEQIERQPDTVLAMRVLTPVEQVEVWYAED